MRLVWARLTGRRRFDALYFEERFREEDPWGFSRREYEKIKYRQTLELIPDGRYRCILEVGCAEGIFTKDLAPKADRLVGIDISARALERARAAFRDRPDVEFRQVDIFEEDLDQRFHLIVCSEVLCFAESQETLDLACRRLAEWVEPDGFVLLVHLRVAHESPSGWSAPDLRFGADHIHRRFGAITGFRLASERWERAYALSLFQRGDE